MAHWENALKGFDGVFKKEVISMLGKATSASVEEEEFSPEELASVDAVIEKYKKTPGALIPALEDIQEAIGYLPKAIQKRVACGLRISPGEVYGVVTFYSFFTMVPRGRHTVRCCLGTACYVKGGKKNLEFLSARLKVQPGETTPDRRYSLETVRCLGACGLAPAMIVDDENHPQVKISQISEIIEAYE